MRRMSSSSNRSCPRLRIRPLRIKGPPIPGSSRRSPSPSPACRMPGLRVCPAPSSEGRADSDPCGPVTRDTCSSFGTTVRHNHTSPQTGRHRFELLTLFQSGGRGPTGSPQDGDPHTMTTVSVAVTRSPLSVLGALTALGTGFSTRGGASHLPPRPVLVPPLCLGPSDLPCPSQDPGLVPSRLAALPMMFAPSGHGECLPLAQRVNYSKV